jgi:hypothetical protein
MRSRTHSESGSRIEAGSNKPKRDDEKHLYLTVFASCDRSNSRPVAEWRTAFEKGSMLARS